MTNSQGTENSLWLQPHAQVIWTRVKADDHREHNGTRVQGIGSDNVQSKLGLRSYLNSKSKDRDTATEFQPFVEANWIHNTRNDGVRMNDDQINVAGMRKQGELKAAVEGNLNRDLSLWVSVPWQVGREGYNVGVKYQF